MSAELHLLGTCEAYAADGRPIAFSSQRERELIASLAVEKGRPVARDVLLDRIWGRDDFQAKKALNTALWRLRNAIREADENVDLWLESDGKSLMMPSLGSPWVDANVLMTLQDPAPLGEARSLFEIATAQAGRFLPDSEGDWVEQMRRQLEAQRAQALHDFIGLFEAQNDAARLRQVAHVLVECDPLEERAWRALMKLHLGEGNKPQAMKLYQQLEQQLREELDVAPSAETRALIHLIREPCLTQSSQKAQATAQEIQALSRRITTLQGALNETLDELQTLTESLLSH